MPGLPVSLLLFRAITEQVPENVFCQAPDGKMEWSIIYTNLAMPAAAADKRRKSDPQQR